MPSAKRIARELRDKDYLIGKTVYWKRLAPSERKEHELCVFCWEPLSAAHPFRNEGFQEEESKDWICFPCLESFIAAFDWQVIWPVMPLTLDASGVPII